MEGGGCGGRRGHTRRGSEVRRPRKPADPAQVRAATAGHCTRNSSAAELPTSWEEFLRRVVEGESPFGSFWRDFLRIGCDGVTSAPLTSTSPLLPMPLPFPEVEGARVGSLCSRRRETRSCHRRLACRWVNRIVAALNFMDQDVPRQGLWRGRRPSELQMEAANLMVVDLLEWCRLPVQVISGGSGRCTALSHVLRRLAVVGYTSFQDVDRLAAVAMPVRAARVAVPVRAGGVDPLDFLRPEEAALFGDWRQREQPQGHLLPPVRPCHRLAPCEEAPL